MKIGLQRKPRRNFEPSIGVMGVMRTACCGFVAVLCSLAWAAPAMAADHDVLKLGSDGRVHARHDRALPADTMPAPPRARARAGGRVAPRRSAGP